MSDFNPENLSVRFYGDATPEGPLQPRRYTLTHSDRTGELFLTIGTDYDRRQVSGLHTRLLRDEVLAEWRWGDRGPVLTVHCHLSGGLVLGTPGWRYRIFQRHMPQVIGSFRCGDEPLLAAHPELANAPVQVHFHTRRSRDRRVEHWGALADFAPPEHTGGGDV